MGRVRNSGLRRICTHRLVSIHIGHHDVHQDYVQVPIVLDHLDGVLTAGGAYHVHVLVFEQGCEREDVAGVVIDHQHFAAAQNFHRAMQPFQHGLLLRRQIGDDPVEEQRSLVQQPFRRTHILQNDALGHRLELCLFGGGQVPTSEDDHRHGRQRRLSVHPLQQLETGHVGKTQVEHDAIKRTLEQGLQRLAAGPDGCHFDVAGSEQFLGGASLDLVVLDDQEPLGARRREFLDPIERRLQSIGRGRFHQKGKGAMGETVLALLLQGDDLHRNMARGRVELQLVENRPSEQVGQENIERDSGGTVLPRERDAHGALPRDDAFEALVARQPEKNTGVMRVVLDDQQHRVAGFDVVAVVLDLGFTCQGQQGV